MEFGGIAYDGIDFEVFGAAKEDGPDQIDGSFRDLDAFGDDAKIGNILGKIWSFIGTSMELEGFDFDARHGSSMQEGDVRRYGPLSPYESMISNRIRRLRQIY